MYAIRSYYDQTFTISAVTGAGVDDLVTAVARELERLRRGDAAADDGAPTP